MDMGGFEEKEKERKMKVSYQEIIDAALDT